MLNSSPFFELPPFAADQLRASSCSQCRRRFDLPDVTGAGVRRSVLCHEHCFSVEVVCPECGSECSIRLPDQRITTHDWPRQFAEMCGYRFSYDVAPAWRWHRMLTLREPQLGLFMRLRKCTNALSIFGGYRRAGAEGPTLLLYRRPMFVHPVQDGVLRLESRSRFRIAELTDEEKLRPGEWESFLDISEGSLFTRDGIRWRKLRRFDIEPLVKNRQFIHASLMHRRGRRP